MNFLFNTEYIFEPQLVFGNRKEERDPKIGLARHGPFRYEDEEVPLQSIRVGIISNRKGITLTESVLDMIKARIPSYHEQNSWLFPDFPGMNQSTAFQCAVITSKNWQATLSDDSELKKITSEELANPNERIAYGVNLFANKIKEISGIDDPPNVIICTLPKIVEEYCGISERTRGAKTAKATQAEIDRQKMIDAGQTFLTQWGATIINEEEKVEKSYDFRNSLKGKVMEFEIPVQILHENSCEHMLNYSTIKKHSKQDPCSFAWNFSTALYYKANGKPWRLAKLPMDTCYVGVSFFKDKLRPAKDIQISMAQVFTHNGEGLVLRGTEVEIDKHTKQPYLKKNQAKLLLSNAITRYIERAKRNPSRIVIHKTTEFSNEEQEGFNEAIYEVGNLLKDFVTIQSNPTDIHFLRVGKFPTLRGTIIHLNEEEFLLYTSGYTPRLRTYPGHSIPNPLLIKHKGDSEKRLISEEILGLTKLDWNTASFSTFSPITIKFAGEVGKILSELSEDKKIKDHYRFFM